MFWTSKLWIRIGRGSGTVFRLKYWILIQTKKIQIRNTASGLKLNLFLFRDFWTDLKCGGRDLAEVGRARGPRGNQGRPRPQKAHRGQGVPHGRPRPCRLQGQDPGGKAEAASRGYDEVRSGRRRKVNYRFVFGQLKEKDWHLSNDLVFFFFARMDFDILLAESLYLFILIASGLRVPGT